MPPVWYIQPGLTENNVFTYKSQASAVLVDVAPIKPDGSLGHPERVLLTVQHAIRSQGDARTGTYTGPFWKEFRAWPAGTHFLEKGAQPLELHPILQPNESALFDHPSDIVFLRFKKGETARPAVPLLPDEDCHEGIEDLTVLGYDAGLKILFAHEDEIIPGPHPGWQYLNYLDNKGSGILAGGGTQPKPGASGGAVMFEDRLAGLYRGGFPDIDQHVFMPTPDIRRWCERRHYRLLDAPRAKRRFPLPFPRSAALAAATLAALALILWAVFALWPTTYHFKGRVMTLPPGATSINAAVPVEGARVTPVYENAEQPELTTYTNQNGEFDIRTRDEKYTGGFTFLRARKDGFTTPPDPPPVDTWQAVEDPGQGRLYFLKPASPSPP